jgi:hypothetical protein
VGLAGSSSCAPACTSSEPSHDVLIPPLEYRLLLCLIAYFGLGAYYNYSTYGASGADLIPCVLHLSSSCA